MTPGDPGFNPFPGLRPRRLEPFDLALAPSLI